MLNKIDYLLERITMYRLVFYTTGGLLGISLILSFWGILSFTPVQLLLSIFWIVIGGIGANYILAKIFNVPSNPDSVYITTCVLALIISPIQSVNEIPIILFTVTLAMASKYLFTFRNKHIVNPAAVGVFLATVLLGNSASWWIGTTYLAPFVFVCGFLIMRKLHFEDMEWSFFTTTFATSLLISLFKQGDLLATTTQVALHSSALFLGFFMLSDPLTLPAKKFHQMIYGAIVGFLSVPQVHFGSLYFAPELALIFGNVYAFIINPKYKLLLHLKNKLHVAPDIMDFIFVPKTKFAYQPGQYMEWTLTHKGSDSRGMRRYLTLASSPTEDTVRLGVKFYEKGSTYKKALINLDPNTQFVGSQLAGEFILPKDIRKKLVFIAGGISITPFRSMVKYLVDINEKRDVALIYINKFASEIVYSDVFREGVAKIGLKCLYSLTDLASIPVNWPGVRGRVTKETLIAFLPDYKERYYYLSGPHNMVTSYKKVLQDLGIPQRQIIVDYFPGLA